MSIASELKKRAGPLGRARVAKSNRLNLGGAHKKLILKAPGQIGDVFEVARLLVRAGVSVRTAKKVVEELAAAKLAHVEAPSIADYDELRRAMRLQGINVHELVPRSVDVRALRHRLNISQEDFAARYCLDVATVRNWEQGRTNPEGPAAALLQAIDSDPDQFLELMLARRAKQARVVTSAKEVAGMYPLATRKYGAEELSAYAMKVSRVRSLFRFEREEA